ncbi:MAG: FAD-binding oxidoreductase [Myxococcales bacterium]|nr:FAD-binding oxidoreductase [Myxococcales bacterium]
MTETQPMSRRTPGLASRAATSERAPDLGDRLTELLVKHRWATVVPVVLPLSKAYDTWWRFRNIWYRNWKNAAHRHEERVRSIQEQMAAWRRAGKPGLLTTSRKGWQTVAVRTSEYKKTSYGIDVELHDILEIDLERRTVKVEPRVNMGQLTEALAPLGVTVPVVPELDDLTAGGLLLGYGIESSSHKYGLFADTVRSAELVLADGSVVTCSAEENADLFHALPWSYGAHGFLTALELPLIPCKPYVRLTYEPVFGTDAICARFEELICADDAPEHVEVLFYDLDRAVVIHGDYADAPANRRDVNAIGQWWKPWFYKHTETALERGAFTEYLPIRDWYHRHTRSLYWHGELLVPFGNHPAFRYPLGWLMPPKVSFMKLTQTERIRRYRDERNVVQDGLVPLRHLREGVQMFHREFECYPLWLCGHKTFRTSPPGMLQPSEGRETEMFVDIGAWQVPRPVKRGEAWDGIQAVKNMEAWLRDHDGYQCLYAVTEQSRDEFWEMFDRTLYEQVREKYGAVGAFMDVYDKVKRPGQP